MLSTHPFNDSRLRDWLFLGDRLPIPAEFIDGSRTIALEGSGPFEEEDFERFLTLAGMDAVYLEPEENLAPEILVIGSQTWDASRITWLVQNRRGSRLRVYSQEMFLLYWLANDDPFDHPEILDDLRMVHPGLMSPISLAAAFDWPTTVVAPLALPVELPTEVSIGFAEVGILGAAGYEVGRRGKPQGERQRILLSVYSSTDLPRDFPAAEPGVAEEARRAYFEKWGEPQSAQRLYEMANCIASLCRLAKRGRTQNKSLAIAHWEADLGWLKRTRYLGRYDGQYDWWPTTSVDR